MASLNRENFLRALYDHHESTDEPSYAQQEFIRSYANGTSDQWEAESIDSIREEIAKPYGIFFKGNSNEVRAEFNRRFNYIIQHHSELWHKYPMKSIDREEYAHRYMRLFQDIMHLFEIFPELGSKQDYRAVCDMYFHYRKIYDKRFYERK